MNASDEVLFTAEAFGIFETVKGATANKTISI